MDDKIIGLIGLGIMGGAIARNLAERNWRVVGFDIDAVRTTEIANSGVQIVPNIAAVVAAVPVIMTSLPSSAAALAVAQEIAAAPQTGRIVAELSTLSLADKFQFKAALDRAGHIALDCPLSGTGAQAKARDLIVYASGDSAAIATCKDVFADFARQNVDLGIYGNGSRMKFIANHLVAIHNVAAAEAMLLAERAGLDLNQVVDVITPGAGGSRMFQMRAPMMAAGTYTPATMKVSNWAKDMSVIAAFAHEFGCETPLFTLTQPIYAKALASGLGEMDTAVVFEVLKAGSPVSK